MTPEDKIYHRLMIKGSKEKLPEGWGRSETSAGVQVSRPRNKAEVNPQVFMENHVSDMNEVNEEMLREASVLPDDYALTANDFTPDEQGFIGGYSPKDMISQLAQMRLSDTEASDLLNEIESEKNMDIKPDRREANRFLEYSIRYRNKDDK